MAAIFPNVYMHRKVADTASRPCEICFKQTTSVLVTHENKDFFYACPSHMKDKGFCSPIIDHAAVEAKRKKELEDEVARVKKEYEEKQKKKKEKEREKKDEKESDKSKDEKKDGEKKDEEKKEEKPEDKKPDDKSTPPEEEPRVFALQRNFYAQRIEKKRQAEFIKRNRERLADPSFFPSVPKGLP